MVSVAQLVRALDCGSSCRGFESPHSPQLIEVILILYCYNNFYCIINQKGEKIMKKILLRVLIPILVIVLIIEYLGFIPEISNLFG